ncbi:MAG: hypothetical protein COA69_00090 [Robiginitomaculum sp.]|nr:MAG: hypothetical protein COA69_00090 [Robiginitomaculum sp.]
MDFIADSNMWLLYTGLFIAPFVQEDTAVIGAAGLSVSHSDHWMSIFAMILIGLIASDSWKYGLGWAARHHKWAKKYADHERVRKLRSSVINHSAKTLIAVRFLPLARIPTYLAAGFFGVPYHKYWLSIAFSAVVYVSIIFASFHILGEIIGEQLKTYMPLVALGFALVLGIAFFIRYRKKH